MRVDGSELRGSAAALRPQKKRASFKIAFESAAAGTVLGVLLICGSIYGFGDYGFLAFLASPFLMGLLSGFVLGIDGPYDLLSRFSVSFFSIVLTAAVLMLLAIEGAVCLAMAAPVAIPMNLLGLWLGSGMNQPHGRPPLIGIVLLFLPLSLGADLAMKDFPIRPIVTTVEIDAPPEIVWDHVVDFEPLPHPREAIFRAGIAYPVRARIEGDGIDAVRYCDFSTGPFVEPITAWDPPHRLAFDVTSQPHPMSELSPYKTIDAPHLVHGLKNYRGEFLLTELPDGRTRLQGTTWYAVRMSPHAYWRAWSDYLIGKVHLRVLRHIKRLSEEETA